MLALRYGVAFCLIFCLAYHAINSPFPQIDAFNKLLMFSYHDNIQKVRRKKWPSVVLWMLVMEWLDFNQ